MLKTKKDFEKAMRTMILRVQSGDTISDKTASIEDMEVLAECIRNGYINGRLTSSTSHKSEEFRTLDGKIHPQIINNIIPLKGLIFLHPQKDGKFIIPTAISLIALIVSIFNH